MKSFPYIKALILVFLLACMAGNLFSQSFTLSGKVTDENNRQPLAFVNIVINNGLTGCMSDIDGKYSITSNEPILSVKFSSIGYETKEVQLASGKSKLNVAMKPVVFELGEVVIGAAANPAHRIIDSVIAHRAQNTPDNLASYSYSIYDKMIFTVDSTRLRTAKSEQNKIKKKEDLKKLFALDSLLKKNDLMVMETVSEVLFKSPDKKKQNVIANRVSGMKDPILVYLVNGFQSVSFYDEIIEVVNKRYVNPISKGSKETYFFRLENVVPMGSDSLFIISFRPRQGTSFNGLEGVMTINSDQWAVQNVKAAPDEKGGLYTVEIQQLYEKNDGQWFPKQLNTNLIFQGFTVNIGGNSIPMAAIGKSYLTDIKINPDLDTVRFSNITLEIDPDAAKRNEAFWAANRSDSLNQRTQATYVFMDSVTKGKKSFDRLLGTAITVLRESAIPLGPFNLDLNRLINVSGPRGWYFGLGLSTNDKISRYFSLSGFYGYWTKIQSIDYGAGLKLKFNPKQQTELSFNVSEESAPIGEFGGFQDSYFSLNEADYKYNFYENVHARQNRAALQFNTRFAQHFKGYLIFSSFHRHYNQQFFHVATDSLTDVQYAKAEVKLRFAYKEKFLDTGKGIQTLGTLYPEVWLSYQHAFPGILGSQFQYDRIKFQISQNFYTKYWGVSKVMMQAGYASASCPVMETFNILGSSSDVYLYAPGSFSTMRPDEFFCDRFAALYLTHNFSGMLLKTQSVWFKPELVLATNIGWGDMPRVKGYTYNFNTMDKGFFESGFIVKGIVNLLWLKLGAGAFYRYGHYAWPNYEPFESVWDNFAWKWSATFTF